MADEDNNELAAPGNLAEDAAEQKEKPAEPKARRTRVSKKAAAPAPKEFHRYRANKAPIHHPYQNKLVPVSGHIELVPDNWVLVQVQAKVIVDMGPA